jgi:phosphatidate cytidylyltransferase
MLRQRVLVTLVLLPVGLWIFAIGGWLFAAAMALVVGLAGREYARLFRTGGLRPSALLLVVGSAALVLARQASGFDGSPVLLAALALVSLTWHLVDYERGASRSGTDFGVTLGGVVYLGWIGAYLVSLRGLPDGLWWLLISLPAVWIGDSAAYSSVAVGRHKMALRLSPRNPGKATLRVVGAALAGADWRSSPRGSR